MTYWINRQISSFHFIERPQRQFSSKAILSPYGVISKSILDRINSISSSSSSTNGKTRMKWSTGFQEQKCLYLCSNGHKRITESILINTLNFAKLHTTITTPQSPRKKQKQFLLLFHDEAWNKKNTACFDGNYGKVRRCWNLLASLYFYFVSAVFSRQQG